MNMAESSIRVFPKLKRGIAENGFQICWLTKLKSIMETPAGENKRQKKTK